MSGCFWCETGAVPVLARFAAKDALGELLLLRKILNVVARRGHVVTGLEGSLVDCVEEAFSRCKMSAGRFAGSGGVKDSPARCRRHRRLSRGVGIRRGSCRIKRARP